MSKTILIIAEEFGKIAFHAGKQQPVSDANCMKLIADHSTCFGGSITIMKAWHKGYHAENLK